MRFQVDKMTCGHCVRTITRAVQSLDPDAKVEADLAHGTVSITGKVRADDAVAAMLAEGYPARQIDGDFNGHRP